MWSLLNFLARLLSQAAACDRQINKVSYESSFQGLDSGFHRHFKTKTLDRNLQYCA